MLASVLSGEFLLHIPCWLQFYLGSFSYISHDGFIFIWGVSLTHPVLALHFCGMFLLHIPCGMCFFKSGEFLLHIPVTLSFYFSFYRGSFSYTFRAGFIFMWGVSLTHPMLTLFLCGKFLLDIPCCLSLFSEEFLLYFLHLSTWSPRFTSRDLYLHCRSLASRAKRSILSGEFLLHIPCCLHFFLRCFSYISQVGYFFQF